jgi:hypothetical protein
MSPEKPQEHNHLHLTVDAALMAELRAGQARIQERIANASLPLPSGDGAADGDHGHQTPTT